MTGRSGRMAWLGVAAAVLVAGVACSSAPLTGPSDPSTAPRSTPSPATRSPTSSPSAAAPVTPRPAPAAAPTLPRGGRTVFPRYRLVGYAGRSGSPTLGRLGTGKLDQRVGEMVARSKPYGADGRQVLPVMEVITTVVQPAPGPDGKYRTRMKDVEIAAYLKVARRHRAVLLLAIQPGRAGFVDEVRAYEKWLRQPDVGVALDPEWAMGKGQVPGRTFGHTTGATLDAVARYLSGLATRGNLPEKIMVFHELAPRIVTGEGKLHRHPGVAVVKSVDGIGIPAAKRNTYGLVNADSPDGVHPGFKLFYEEDRHLMKPAAVLKLSPRPEYVLYE